jgi:hypothetical protein
MRRAGAQVNALVQRIDRRYCLLWRVSAAAMVPSEALGATAPS